MNRLLLLALVVYVSTSSESWAQSVPNLLRNGSFQDDWITQVPQNMNHHWCYASEFYHRRDFNPDGWTCKGSWHWLNAQAPAGQRILRLQGPASVSQRVNWVLVHDHATLGNMADAGRFPQIRPVRSKVPERVVRDLTFKVRLSGDKVPAKAGTIEIGLGPPGGLSISDPLGSMTAPTVTASVSLPEGTFKEKWVEVKLTAADWLKTALAAPDKKAKKPKEAEELEKFGPVLPGTVRVSLDFKAKEGHVDLEQAELAEAGPAAKNLLFNSSFEIQKSMGKGELVPGWTGPSKYRFFPGRLYYIFNTWHNGNLDNRGKVQLDPLVAFSGRNSLQMIVPSGDEVAVASTPITLNQKEARLIEVHAMVKTDSLAMLHLDALDEKGDRLDAFPFIHMAPQSIGTDEWRRVRQVFSPKKPLQSIKIVLAARGVNGYTLTDTGHQPQNNVAGLIWWDDVKVFEPETTPAELSARKVRPAGESVQEAIHIQALDLGERLLGDNVLTVKVANPGPSEETLFLEWEFTSPSGKYSKFTTDPQKVKKETVFRIPYAIHEPCPPYQEYRGKLTLLKEKGKPWGQTELWFSTWTVPIDLQLGALYLRPGQKQLVRMNLGLAAPVMKKLAKVRLEVVRRGTGKVLQTQDIPAAPGMVESQRQKIPKEMREDFRNLLLADLDVSFLPLQPFADPQRNWLVRATALDQQGKALAAVDSPPFCRQEHDPPQPPIKDVAIKNHMVHVNGRPWMPWGVVYGHVPVYEGPADPGQGKYLDLQNLPPWSMYDRFTAAPYTRQGNDFNCLRYVAASITPFKNLEERWQKDNLYASSVFAIPHPAFSLEELFKMGKGKDMLSAYLTQARTAPMVVSTAPGIEEAFGLFHQASPEQLKGLAQIVDYLRKETGKPVMVGHGGYWNRLEFEKVPFFDIYDPETEPLYPANLHTDLGPLLKRSDQAIWLRPQMYEDVPYERWRFHVFVEMMRGCRGWQFAHGPGDQSLFRGLHGEIEFFKPILASTDPGPKIDIQPTIENWSRRHQGKTYLIAATTRGLTLGKWRPHPEPAGAPVSTSRLTADAHLFLSDANSYGADQPVDQGPTIHGVNHLPDARSWPKGSKLVQWVRLDGKTLPESLVILAKKEGRWIHAASWGKFDAATWLKETDRALWFLRSFYRHSYGFLGWDHQLVDRAREYLPTKSVAMGELPKAGDWVQLEIPLDKIGAADGLLDGVGFVHHGGQVWWGKTILIDPDGKETLVWGEALEHPPETLAQTRIQVPGLKAGAKVRVLFEDREIIAQDGFFLDDFRGQDLYQRFGGSYGIGYGNGPVALHLYEIP